VNGTQSLYLEFYPGYRDMKTMKLIRRKALGIYVITTPRTEAERKFNAKMLQKAEAVRCRVFEEVVDDRYGFFNKGKLEEDFLAYFRELLRKKNDKWRFVYKHFELFIGGKCTFGELDVDLCRKFHNYLLEAKCLGSDIPMSRNSVAGYWSTFRGLLKILYRDHMIKENINDYLDRIECESTMKETLTLEEVNRLFHTPCEIPVLKAASIFSCLTGLRRSDLRNLTWDSVRTYADGGKYLAFVAQKTKKESHLPISDQAFSLIPERDKRSDKVFPHLSDSMTHHPLKKWLQAAGITKHITFHCFRHTYASLQIEFGTDIYTVQDLLGHKDVGTTQIYARHADPRKRSAAGRIVLTELNSGETPKSE
jgi:site-specific recombinase XerD